MSDGGFENNVEDRLRPEDPPDDAIDRTSSRSRGPCDAGFEAADEPTDELIEDETLGRGGCSDTEGRPFSPNELDMAVLRREGVLKRSVAPSDVLFITAS